MNGLRVERAIFALNTLLTVVLNFFTVEGQGLKFHLKLKLFASARIQKSMSTSMLAFHLFYVHPLLAWLVIFIFFSIQMEMREGSIAASLIFPTTMRSAKKKSFECCWNRTWAYLHGKQSALPLKHDLSCRTQKDKKKEKYQRKCNKRKVDIKLIPCCFSLPQWISMLHSARTLMSKTVVYVLS